MKRILFLFIAFVGITAIATGQPTVLGTQLINGSYTTYDLNTVGGFKQIRLQATSAATSGARNWEFASGTAGAVNYGVTWRPYTTGQVMSVNTFIPTTFANGARYTVNSGSSGLLPAIVANSYYTFNVSNLASADNTMALLETSYNPTAISSVTRNPATPSATQAVAVTVTTATAPQAGENVFVRYSTTSNFVSSTLVQASFTGTTGVAYIPGTTAGTTIYYYVFSSNASSATIGTNYDMFTLNLNNNSGANYSYTVAAATASTFYTWNPISGSQAWNVAANWTPTRTTVAATDVLQFINGGSSTATNVPAETVSRIIVANNTTVNLQSAATATLIIASDGTSTNELTVEAGSSLISNGTTAALTITYGGTGSTGNIAGTMEITSPSGTIANAFNFTGGTTPVTTVTGTLANGQATGTGVGVITGTTATLIMASGSTYNHKFQAAAGTIPIATWSTGSTCLISGYIVGGPLAGASLNQTFSNFTWNCPAQTGNINHSYLGTMAVTGTMTVVSTGTGSLRWTGTGAYTINVVNYVQTGGTVDLANGTSISTMTFNISGSLSHTGGTLSSGGTVTCNPILHFNGTTNQAVSFATAPTGPITYRISNPAGITLTGPTATFPLGNGTLGGLRISTTAADPVTFTGTSTTFAYNAANSTLTYDAAGNVTATAVTFPSASGPTGLTINVGTGNVVNVPFSRTVGTNITMTAGDIDMTSNTLTLGTAATSAATAGVLSYTAGNIRVTTGRFTRWYASTVALQTSIPSSGIGFYPLANGSGAQRRLGIYNSVSVTTSTGGTISAGLTDGAGMTTASFSDGAFAVTKITNGSWNLTQSGVVLSAAASLALTPTTGIANFTAITNLRLTQAAAALGTHVAAGGTITTPIVSRTGLTLANMTAAAHVIASGTADAAISSKQTGLWHVPGTWDGGVVPGCGDAPLIASGTTVTVDATSGTPQTGNTTIAAGGTLVVSGGTLTVGCTLNNNSLTNNGTLTVSGGILNINGNFNVAAGTFNQSGGTINVDGTGATSAAGSIVNFTGGAYNLSGGTLTIVDPAIATTQNAFTYSGTPIVICTGTHTTMFGDGSSTQVGTTDGFLLNNPTTKFNFRNLIINGTALGANRFVKQTATSISVLGDMTINANSEHRSSTYSIHLAGNLINNGTLISDGTGGDGLRFNNFSTGASVAVTNAQSVSGTGVFANASASPTANATIIVVNNSNATGVTLNVPLSVSNTLTMTSGIINTSATSVLQLGTATVAGTLSGTPSATNMVRGPFARTFAASRTATGTYTNTTLFPTGKGTSYLPIFVDPTTTASGPVIFTSEAFTSNTGTLGTSVLTLGAERWQALPTTGSANLTTTFIRLGDANIATLDKILQSASASGSYESVPVSTTYAAGTPNTLTTAAGLTAYTGFLSFGTLNPCSVPTAQPTVLTFPNKTTLTVAGTFTAASPAPSHYLVVRYPSASAVTNPVDFTSYASGNTLGLGTVVSSGTTNTFTATGLSATTTYDFYVYSYNNSGCFGPVYMTAASTPAAAPLTASVTTCTTTTGTPGTPTSSLISASGFTATWTMSSTTGVDYEIDLSTSSTFTTYVSGFQALNVGTGILTKTFTGLNPVTTYYTRVRAVITGCSSANTSNLTVVTLATPTITAISNNACAGPATLTITGTNLAGSTSVTVGGTAATILTNTATSITATVAAGVSGIVVSTNPNGTASSATSYSVGTLALVTVTPSVASLCGAGGTSDLTASSAYAGYTYAWTSLSAGATLSTTTGATTTATLTATGDIKLTASDAGLACATDVFTSIGVYPFPSATMTATSDTICLGSSVTVASGLSAGNFSYASIPHAPLSAPSNAVNLCTNGSQIAPLGTPVSGGDLDDGGWSGIPLNFSFNFFGTSYSTVAVGTNGTMMFGTVPGFGTTAGQLGQYIFNTTPTAFPNTGNPGNVIATPSRDNDLKTAGNIKYWTEGYAPNRRFIVAYIGVPEFGNTGTTTSQVIFYETLGIVEIHTTNASTNGAKPKLIGLQNATKDVGATAINGSTGNIVNQGYRFSPPTNYTTTWSGPDITTTPVTGTNIFNINATPATVGTKTYSIVYTNSVTSCSNSTSPATRSIVVSPATVVGTITGTSAVCNDGVNTGTLTLSGHTGAVTKWQSSSNLAFTTPVNIANTTNTLTFSNLTATTYYRAAVKSGACLEGFTPVFTVTVNPLPATPTITGTLSFCTGGSTVLTSSATTGNQWYKDGALVSGETATTYTATTVGSYTVVVTSAAGCTSAVSAASVVTESPLPTASIAYSNGPICSGSNATFTLTGTSGATVTYNLNGTSATATLTGGTATVTATAATANQVLALVSITDGTCGQTLTGSSTVTVNPAANAGTVVALTPNPCQGTTQTVTLADLLTGEDTGGTWTTNPANPSATGFNAGAGTFTTGANIAGDYKFTYTVTGTTPCPNDAKEVTVTIVSCGPTAATIALAAGAPSTVCAGATSSIAVAITGGTSPYEIIYSIDGVNQPAVTGYVSNNPIVVTPVPTSPATTVEYKIVSVKDDLNQTGTGISSTGVSVTVNPLPAAGTDTYGLCSSTTTATFNLDAFATVSTTINPSGATVTWFTDAGLTTAATPSGAFVSPSATVYAKVTNATCSNSTPVTLTVNTNPTITLVTVAPVCLGATSVNLPYTATGTPTQYTLVPDASAMTAGFTTVTYTTLPATPIALAIPGTVAAGTYNFTLKVKSAALCESADVAVVAVITALPLSAGTNGTLTVCAGTTPTNAQLFGALGGTPAAGGTWTNSGLVYTYTQAATSPCTVDNTATVTVTETTPITPTFTAVSAICSGATLSALLTTSTNGIAGTWSPALNNTATTTYTFTPTAGQCATTTTMTITVNPLPTVAPITGMPAVCVGTTTTLANSTAGGVWSSSDMVIAAVDAVGVVTGVAVGSATISYAVTNAAGCTTTVTGLVAVNGNPTAAIIPASPTVCGSATTTTITAAGGSSYLWSNTTAIAANPVGVGSYTVTVTNSDGCTATASTNVTATAITVDAGSDMPTCPGSATTLTVIGTSGATYTWNDPANSTTASIMVTPMTTTTYTVTATVGACTATDAVIVNVGAAALASSGSDNLAITCEDGTWSYYAPAATPDKFFFAIEWGTANATTKTTAKVDIKLSASVDKVEAGADGTYTMKRYWDVHDGTAAKGPLTLAAPVNVRFFYDVAEKAAVDNAATAYLPAAQATNPAAIVEPSSWFKTADASGAYNPATRLTAPGLLNCVLLTDVSSGATMNGIAYAQFNGLTGFSGGTYAGGVGAATVLPITLSKFTAKKVNNDIQLAWVTQTEKNVARFEVERSADAQNFISIGTKSAKGNSNVALFYDLMDTRPLSGNNYYRLKTTDNDGSVTYSSVVNVFFGKSFNADIRPNPVRNDLNIVTFADEKMDINIRVFDMTGKEVLYIPMGINKNTDSNSIDVTQLLPGVYNIRFENANHSLLENRKFVKVN